MSWLKGVPSAESYRLVAAAAFSGTPVSYGEKALDGEAARSGPSGFYHGMSVRHAGQMFVLSGPPMTMVDGVSEQLDLFG
jgi:hypothetical protein